MKNPDAARQAAYRARYPEKAQRDSQRAQMREKARRRAWATLAANHPDEFDALYATELMKVGEA